MENKMIRWFVRIFVISCIIFSVCMCIQIYKLITTCSTWTSWYNFLWIMPTPLLGYLMMKFGEYIDTRKKY